jgi:hypothetical protein
MVEGVMCVVVIAGCGRLAFDPSDDGGYEPSAPDGQSRTNATMRCSWAEGEPTRATAPAPVTSLTSGMGEYDPFLVPDDPHTMYFGSGRSGDGDIYQAHRAALDVQWGPPIPVSELNTDANFEGALVVDAGAVHGYYSMFDYGSGRAKLYELTRTSTSAPYRVVRELTELDTNTVQYDPFPSPDELTMHFTAGGGTDDLRLYVATRATAEATWNDVQRMPYGTAGASQQSLTSDQLVVFWSAQNGTNFDLYYAVRPAVTDPFGPPKRLSVSTPDNDYEPYIREDGCELHWSRSSAGASEGNLYEVMFAPQ